MATTETQNTSINQSTSIKTPVQPQPLPPKYEPAPGNYTPPPPYAQQPIIYTQPIMGPPRFGEAPSRLTCPGCQMQVLTRTNTKVGLLPWLVCLGICGVGLFFPLAWCGCQFIPFCVSSLKDVVHTCPNCNTHVGTYSRMD